MRKWHVSLTIVVGLAMGGACGFNGQGGGGDAGPDGPDAPPIGGCTKWQPFVSTIDPCNSMWGTPAPLMLSNGTGTVNTATGVLTVGSTMTMLPSGELQRQAGDGAIRVFNLSALVVNGGATLTVTGTHAALFLVHDNVAINGTIEASALDTSPARGPGGNPLTCATAGTGAPAADDVGGGGGGGGGAHGDAGAMGGDAQSNGGTGGQPDITSLVWRGGCPGGKGGAASTQLGGEGGGSGGAVAISSRGAITIQGGAAIHTNGAPGAAGQASAGGGGGGAGGSIALDGYALVVTGNLCANGGGGGGGGGNSAAGDRGSPVQCTANGASGGGGGGSQGGNGGAGAALNAGARVGGNRSANGGGGGGGGGAGKIFLRSRGGQAPTINVGAIISPTYKPL